jgi:hypothetical protein
VAGKTPINPAFEVGDIRRWGVISGDDCTTAIQNCIDTCRFAIIPELFTARISETINIGAAGCAIRGKSRFTSIIQPVNDFTDSALIANTNQASGTTYGHCISDIFFKSTAPNGTDLNVICVDLASCNNSVVQRCRFSGSEGVFADQIGTGVRFSAPLGAGAYSNRVIDCNFTLVQYGVLYAGGSNHNSVEGGEFITCAFGVHADPSSAVDTVKIIGPRFEDCDVGILEKTTQASFIACRFEGNHSADIEFLTGSNDCSIFGGMTADSLTVLKNSNLAAGLQIFADDLRGVYVSHSSDSRATELIGPNVLAPHGDTGSVANPPGITAVAAYFRNGRAVLDNNAWLMWRNAAGTGGVFGVQVDTSDRIRLGNGNDIRWGRPLVSLGGGAAPTLGTIGGSGPATAAQNSWMRVTDDSGVAFFVPAWK